MKLTSIVPFVFLAASATALVAGVPRDSSYGFPQDEYALRAVARSPTADPGFWDDVKDVGGKVIDKAKDAAGNVIDTIKDAADGRIDKCTLVPCAADLGPSVLDCVKAALAKGKKVKDDLACISGVGFSKASYYRKRP